MKAITDWRVVDLEAPFARQSSVWSMGETYYRKRDAKLRARVLNDRAAT